MLEDSGFVDVKIGEAVDTFGGAGGQDGSGCQWGGGTKPGGGGGQPGAGLKRSPKGPPSGKFWLG